MPSWETLKVLFRKRKSSSGKPQHQTEDDQEPSTSGQKRAQHRSTARRGKRSHFEDLERYKGKPVVNKEGEILLPSFVRASVIEKCPVIPTSPNMLMGEDTAEKLSRVMSKFESLDL